MKDWRFAASASVRLSSISAADRPRLLTRYVSAYDKGTALNARNVYHTVSYSDLVCDRLGIKVDVGTVAIRVH